MLQLFSYGFIARASAAIGAFVILFLSMFGQEVSAWHLILWIVRAGTVTYLGLEVLNWSGLWRYLWKKNPFLQRFYPDLQGTWRGHVKSNYRAWETKNINDEYNREITMRIFVSLFQIRVFLESADAYSTSETLLVYPVRRDGGSPARLRYMYKNTTVDPKPTDEQFHMGAAEVAISAKDGLALRGVYWTNRKWTEGANTAGTIEVQQISSDPNVDAEF